MSAVRGPDVSSYQGYPDWSAVKRGGFAFAFCKATEGTGYHDKPFNHNWTGIRENGLVRGAYHFAHADPGESASAQANYFLSYVRANGGWKSDDIPALDIEAGSLSGSALDAWIDDWCRTVEKAWRPGVIYSGGWYLEPKHVNLSGPRGRGWKLWTSAYGSRPTVYAGYSSWTFWQFTNGKVGPSPHSVPGIGNCDISVFNGTLDQLKTFAGGTLEKHQYASRTLREGMSGTDVRRLQGFLNKRLTNRGWPKITADGHYGSTTEKAKHWATYVLGLPTSVVKRDNASARVQHYIRHPSDRPQTFKDRAKARKAEKPDQFTPPKKPPIRKVAFIDPKAETPIASWGPPNPKARVEPKKKSLLKRLLRR